MSTKTIIGFMTYLLAGLLSFSACQNEDFENILTDSDNDMVYFGMNLPEVEDIIVTRATASELEKVIYTVHVLAFDKDEKCFYNKQIYDGYNAKSPYSTAQALGIPKQTGAEYENSTIWIIANVGKQTGVSGGTFNFDAVTTLDDLEAIYGYLVLQEKTTRDCIPMTGKAEGVNMTLPTSVGAPISIDMKRILARISFTVDVPNSNLEFYFNNWSVKSLPRYTYVMPQGKNIDTTPTGQTFAPYYPSNSTETALVTYSIGKWLHEDPTIGDTHGFYMYENLKGGRLSEPDINNLHGTGYSEEIKNLRDNTGTDPKFKTFYAPANASFLILTGLIREKDTQNVTSFTYKIALGANNYNDYNIMRNYNYVYNIHINGTAYDDVTVDVNAFDSRVHKAYALQISAPYCDKMDAHYDKRYLDITASAGELQLQFYPTQEDAEAGTNPITSEDWIVLSEMNTYNIDIDPYESTSKTYTFNDVEHIRNYIYTNENLTKSARSVVLKVTHTPATGSSGIVQNPVFRYYTYTQAGVIEVNGVYVESYEEYTMNLDPDETAMPTMGLQWGWSGTEIDAYNTSDGHGNTSTIINTSGNPGDFTTGSIYNDYAARYCDYKNKRDEYGVIIEHNWYLPAIDELIPLTSSITTSSASWSPVAMTGGKGYWSSTVPTYNETTTNPWSTTGLQAILHWLWNLFIGSQATDPDFEFYYTKVAKAAIDGEEQMEEAGSQGSNRVHAYNKRTGVKYVRAVRVKE